MDEDFETTRGFRVARVAFMVGAVPTMLLGVAYSFVVPQGGLPAWLAFGGGWQVQLVLGLTFVASFAVGLIVAAPFFVVAIVTNRHNSGSDSSGPGHSGVPKRPGSGPAP
ncbi:MAG: hypothetical protein WBB44_00450 [Candidatus Nanopelagicales bacterium]|nr:hypothetical protein [Candidatus Nanopelagicales bacterium]